MKKALSFDDTLILPSFSEVRTRKDCDTSVDLNGLVLNTPIISSNMDTVTGPEMCHVMGQLGGIGALHRFYDPVINGAEYLNVNKNNTSKAIDCIVSVGVTSEEQKRVNILAELGAKYFMIDVANGASQSAVNMFVWMRQRLGTDAWISVGNFGTAASYSSFYTACQKIQAGISQPNAIKVGIGGGSMCTTRIVTGCGVPTLASLLDFYVKKDLQFPKIIADGGIKNSGDIAKALAAGADAVMVGSLLAGTDEAPGEVINEMVCDVRNATHWISDSGKLVKIDFELAGSNDSWTARKIGKKYRGSASAESYGIQGKTADHRTAEGASTMVSYKGPVAPIITELKAGLQSAMSYVNAFTIEEFKQNAELIEITSSGMAESRPHGIKK